MTLNGHSALKSSFGLGIWKVSVFWLWDKTVRKFAELRVSCHSAAKM